MVHVTIIAAVVMNLGQALAPTCTLLERNVAVSVHLAWLINATKRRARAGTFIIIPYF